MKDHENKFVWPHKKIYDAQGTNLQIHMLTISFLQFLSIVASAIYVADDE